MIDAESLGLNPEAETWLAKIRTRLPDEGTAVATVHRLSRKKYLVSFRASAYGETFISEAREEDLETGIREAGARLYERLETASPGAKKNLGDRVRELFGENPSS